MNLPCRTTRTGAFTLIELLVSVAIIGLLVGLLLPTLGKARDTARSALCLSNQRQMTVGLLAYADSHDGTFVPMEQRTGGQRLHWFGLESTSGAVSNRPLDPTHSPLAPYLAGDLHAALACPAFPDEDRRFVYKFDTRSAHYGYNARLAPLYFQVASGQARTRAIHEVRQPAATVAFADGVFLDGLIRVDGRSAFYEPHYMLPTFGGSYGGFAHFRHSDRANAVFLDGHAEARRVVGPVLHVLAGSAAGDLDDRVGPDSLYGF